MIRTQRPFLSVMLAGLLGTSLLTGCQASGQKANTSDRIDAALERAAGQASSQGNTKESLSLVERIYKRNPNDPATAVRYAKALRENGNFQRAALVIEPMAKNPKASSPVLAEYAAVLGKMGNFAESEVYARKAVMADEKNGYGYYVLGLALQAQGKAPQAESAFRSAMQYWEGDTASLMNNFALALAENGNVDEAIEILRKARDANPGRMEIERNLRIITTLQQSGYTKMAEPPLPARRPK